MAMPIHPVEIKRLEIVMENPSVIDEEEEASAGSATAEFTSRRGGTGNRSSARWFHRAGFPLTAAILSVQISRFHDPG
jgi:hypothetical protein